MKNYLFKSLFKIVDPNWNVVDRSHEHNLYDNYVGMHQCSTASYTQHLKGNWEFKFVGGNCDTIHQAFVKTFWSIHDLWHREPCNILYTDPDTIAMQSFDPWGKYDKFMMFNYTDPRQFHTPNIYNRSFEHFFNAGVRYFPSTMSKEIWKQGADMARQWDHNTYDTEQIILNAMLWDQGLDVSDALDPTVAWQFFGEPRYCESWNGVTITQAKILHLHSSRGAENRLQVMKKLSEGIK
jgi:hypothetical protein